MRSLNDMIRSEQHGRGDRDVECLDGFEVDRQLELRRLLDRKISRPGTLEDLVDVRRHAPETLCESRIHAFGLDHRDGCRSRQVRDERLGGVRFFGVCRDGGREHDFLL